MDEELRKACVWRDYIANTQPRLVVYTIRFIYKITRKAIIAWDDSFRGPGPHMSAETWAQDAWRRHGPRLRKHFGCPSEEIFLGWLAVCIQLAISADPVDFSDPITVRQCWKRVVAIGGEKGAWIWQKLMEWHTAEWIRNPSYDLRQVRNWKLSGFLGFEPPADLKMEIAWNLLSSALLSTSSNFGKAPKYKRLPFAKLHLLEQVRDALGIKRVKRKKGKDKKLDKGGRRETPAVPLEEMATPALDPSAHLEAVESSETTAELILKLTHECRPGLEQDVFALKLRKAKAGEYSKLAREYGVAPSTVTHTWERLLVRLKRVAGPYKDRLGL